MVNAKRVSEEQKHPLLGTVLRGTYRLDRLVDSRGAGAVFEARHLRLNRSLAVKVLKRQLRGDLADRFEREAEAITQLEHPNIVQVFDFDTTETGEPYLVMEHLSGKTLAAVLEAGCRLELNRVARIAYQAASALDAAHRAGIVHRNLKPSTVFLVDVPPEGAWTKLLDFGLSRLLRGDAHFTEEHIVLDPPDYIAPEQIHGQEGNALSDQYTLGVIAFQAIAGHTPFLGSGSEILRSVASGHLMPLSHFIPEAHPRVEGVLRRAMAKTPAQRFPSALEFAEALLASTGTGGAAPTSRELADTEPPPAPPRSLQRPASINQLIDQARESFGLGDVDLAARYVESALALSERLGDTKSPALEQANLLIETIVHQRLGTGSKLNLVEDRLSEVSLMPEQAFLVSRIEGPTTVDELLDVSPLSRAATFRHLLALLRLGVLVLE